MEKSLRNIVNTLQTNSILVSKRPLLDLPSRSLIDEGVPDQAF
jgi:hypothetical protein